MAGASKIAKRLQSKGICLADWRLVNNKSDIVDFELLVGADYFYEVVNPFRLPIHHLGMWLSFDRFGRNFLFGQIPGSKVIKKQQNVNYVSIQNLNVNTVNLKDYIRSDLPILDNNEFVDDSNAFNVVKELNNFDAMGFSISSREDDDKEALETFTTNMYKDKLTNKYIVGFPWINNIPPTPEDLDSNYGLVLAMFHNTMKTLDKDTIKLQQYKDTHEKEAAMDFIERVPLNELNDKYTFKHYINHFPVFKQESATSKCRRVFDASLHKRGKACLNDKMYRGSMLTPHILKVLLRIRLIRNLFTLDISKAFLRMVLKLSDRNFTCFFSRDDISDPNSPISVWRFKSVLFGATSSPFLLNCTVADILKSNEFHYNLEVFVDNLFVLDNEEDNIIPAAESLIKFFENSAMPLHEFASNSKLANTYFKSKDLITNDNSLKLLGMIWMFDKDELYIKEPVFETLNITKRSLLSNIARIFDPVGFLGPLTIQGRVLVQETLESKFSWDDALPSEFLVKWEAIVIQFRNAFLIPIPRWIGLELSNIISLHAFTDSSDKALGVVIYLVSGKSSVFVSSKPKVCPLRMLHFTIPRKELAALALGTRHLLFVIDAICKYAKIESYHIWCDSTLSLTWCSVSKPHKELFIRARVDDVQQKVARFKINLHYIITSQNPADMLTKNTGKSLNDPLWKHGPQILQCPEMWSTYKPTKANIDAIPVFCGHVSVQESSKSLPDINKFKSLKDLLAGTVEFIKDNSISGDKAINHAETLWIKHIQSCHFSDIIKFLQNLNGNNLRSLEGKRIVRSQKLIAPSLCHNLHLILDKDGIIRIKTSLVNCPNLT